MQVGDPFMEKLLLEACLEILQTGAVVGIQDMGAAGLTCSCCETAARGNSGTEIDVTLVPKRETGMIPYEIMLSESQERMLIIVDRNKKDVAKKIFDKWGLHATEIGRVTGDGFMTIKENGKVVARIPAKKIADDAPVYHRETREPAYLEKTRAFDPNSIPQPTDYNAVMRRLIAQPSIASKRWVYEQYDHMVRTNTELLPGSDCTVLRVKGTDKRLAATLDGNGRYCYLDPFEGGKTVVAEAARNVVCSGAVPQGVTDCLNFGNPMDPEVFWQFKECARGITEACRAFDVPVTGGNVSFYNESPVAAIYPTPIIGMVGTIEPGVEYRTQFFQRDKDVIVLLGRCLDELGGSEYLFSEHNLVAGRPPAMDLKLEKQVQEACLKLIRMKLVRSAHDCSEGGLAVCLAESCVSGPKIFGAQIDYSIIDEQCLRHDCVLFGETQSRIVLSAAPEALPQILRVLREDKTPHQVIGTVTEEPVFRFAVNGKERIRMTGAELRDLWENAIPRLLAGAAVQDN